MFTLKDNANQKTSHRYLHLIVSTETNKNLNQFMSYSKICNKSRRLWKLASSIRNLCTKIIFEIHKSSYECQMPRQNIQKLQNEIFVVFLQPYIPSMLHL